MTTPRVDPKYQVVRKLREGGMGAIYLVRHRLLDELRVIKVLRSQLNTDEDLRERFLREAKTAIQLRHPNIAQLYDFSVDEEGNASIVLEYIDGLTLEEFGRRPEARNLAVDLAIARQALRALGYLHRKGYVHRDISPDNLMLTKDVEGDPLVKLIDLGIVKILRGGDGKGTATSLYLGKPRYSSPEQLTSPRIDARADLYSFGVLLYEMVTGCYPIQGHDLPSLIAAHLHGTPVSFDVSDPDERVPPDLRALLFSAMAKAPEERPQSAEEFSHRLAEIAARLPAPSRVQVARLIDAARDGARHQREEALSRAGSEILAALDHDELGEARERLAAAVEQLGNDPELLELGRRIDDAARQKKLADAEQERFEILFAEAEAALAADDVPGALSKVTEVLARRPDDPRARALAQRIDERRREAERQAEARRRSTAESGATLAAHRDAVPFQEAPTAEMPVPADVELERPARPVPPRSTVAVPEPAAGRAGWLRPVGLVVLLAAVAVAGWLLWRGMAGSGRDAEPSGSGAAVPEEYVQGLGALERGDLAAAAASFRLAVTRDGVERPDYLPYFFLGQALAQARSCEEAIKALEISEAQGAIQASPQAALLPSARALCAAAPEIDEPLRLTETALAELERQVAEVEASRISTEVARLWAAEPDLLADFEAAKKMVEDGRALATRAREQGDLGLAYEASDTVADARTRLSRVLGAIELRIGRELGADARP
ncbi:MAG TPA: protein kinase [Thermoanaerobaculia bacterium]|nr:protein kinase [Thermoanaerobaculia bacterium]